MYAIVREADWGEVLEITKGFRITYIMTKIKGQNYYVITSGPAALVIRIKYEYWPSELGEVDGIL